MAEQLNRVVAEVENDNLVNSAHATNSFAVTVLSGQGKLKRGTALALNAAGKAVILGTDDGATPTAKVFEANCILQKDVDATSADAVAIAYREGHFNADALIVKTGYTLTAADKEAFRKCNIILSESL